MHGLAQVTPSPKELAQATHDQPQTCGGSLPSLARALAASDAQATQATTHRAATAERTWQERYLPWRQQALGRVRQGLPAEALATLEAEDRARLVAEGTPVCALRMGVRAAVDTVLAAQAGLPTFEMGRARQEAGR